MKKEELNFLIGWLLGQKAHDHVKVSTMVMNDLMELPGYDMAGQLETAIAPGTARFVRIIGFTFIEDNNLKGDVIQPTFPLSEIIPEEIDQQPAC